MVRAKRICMGSREKRASSILRMRRRRHSCNGFQVLASRVGRALGVNLKGLHKRLTANRSFTFCKPEARWDYSYLRVTVLRKCHGAESISAREAHRGSHGQKGEGHLASARPPILRKQKSIFQHKCLPHFRHKSLHMCRWWDSLSPAKLLKLNYMVFLVFGFWVCWWCCGSC